MSAVQVLDAMLFLSTPSARRATNAFKCGARRSTISIHALREEGDPDTRQATAYDIISIHALREEGDCTTTATTQPNFYNFYPRPPRGGRRNHHSQQQDNQDISIHALREEGDL